MASRGKERERERALSLPRLKATSCKSVSLSVCLVDSFQVYFVDGSDLRHGGRSDARSPASAGSCTRAWPRTASRRCQTLTTGASLSQPTMTAVKCSHSLDSEIARFFGFAPFTTTGAVSRTVLVPVQFLQCRVHADAFSAAAGPFFSSFFPFPFSLFPPPPPSRHLVRARLLLAGADLHFQDRLRTP